MKLTTLTKVWLIGVLALGGLMGCHKDDDDQTEPEIPSMVSEPIVGSWLQNSSSNSMIGLTETCYEADGTMRVNTVIVNTEINEIINYGGTWNVTDESLSETYQDPFTDQTTVDRYHVMFSDKYSLVTEHEGLREITQSDKIVATQTLSVEETSKFIIEDEDFFADEYKSTDSHVVTIDEKGDIKACTPGVAYVIASSPIGNVVNKITVTSPLVTDDFVSYMGESINSVTAELGNIYYTVPGDPITFRYFQLPNPIIRQVCIGYAMQKVYTLTAFVRLGTNMDEIMEAWDKMYETASTSKLIHTYKINRDGQNYYAMLDATDGSISIIPFVETPPSPSTELSETDFTQFAWLPGTPVNDASIKLNYNITPENMEDGVWDTLKVSDNNAFESLSVLFDESEEPFPVTTVIMKCKKDITQDIIEPYLAKVFSPTGEELNPYKYDMGNGCVYVYFKTSGSRLNVYYSTSKRKR